MTYYKAKLKLDEELGRGDPWLTPRQHLGNAFGSYIAVLHSYERTRQPGSLYDEQTRAAIEASERSLIKAALRVAAKGEWDYIYGLIAELEGEARGSGA